MQLFDTHCHIQEEISAFHGANDTRWQSSDVPAPDTQIADAAKAGVEYLLCVGTTVRSSRLAVEFVKTRSNCWAAVGLHPHDAKGASLEELASLLTANNTDVKQNKVVAIGECGLDYFYEHSPKEQQLKTLKFQIELALKHDLPLIFHVREAFDDFWPIFDSYQGIRGVVHSFTDSKANLDKILQRGLSVGVNGIATFTKNAGQLEVYKSIPLQNLVLETDAPFLTPAPLRGRVNVPANVSLVAEFLAALRGESLTDLAEATTLNARRLFSIN